ncbi:hypothetical protein MPLSOD_30148 [Mesorhizobium sp. SOD10]|nr:hypothetical protein MPLSOD_30148 [Mesorhizobium sp. SOD10]
MMSSAPRSLLRRDPSSAAKKLSRLSMPVMSSRLAFSDRRRCAAASCAWARASSRWAFCNRSLCQKLPALAAQASMSGQTVDASQTVRLIGKPIAGTTINVNDSETATEANATAAAFRNMRLIICSQRRASVPASVKGDLSETFKI